MIVGNALADYWFCVAVAGSKGHATTENGHLSS